MRISYDSEVDALYIRFRETTVTTKELGEGIAVDVDADLIYSGDIQFTPHIESVDQGGLSIQIIYSRPPGEAGGVRALDLDVDEGKIFWLESTGIGDDFLLRRADLAGTNVEMILVLPGDLAAIPRGLALDTEGQRIYWTESGLCGNAPTGRLRSCRYDGGDLKTELDGLGVLLDIEVMR